MCVVMTTQSNNPSLCRPIHATPLSPLYIYTKIFRVLVVQPLSHSRSLSLYIYIYSKSNMSSNEKSDHTGKPLKSIEDLMQRVVIRNAENGEPVRHGKGGIDINGKCIGILEG